MTGVPWQTLGVICHRLITLLLVVWLAAFAPATCQYHGFLLRLTHLPEQEHLHVGTHSRREKSATLAGVLLADTLLGTNPESEEHSMVRHKPIGNDTSLMSLLALAIPHAVILGPLAHFSQVLIQAPLPRQFALPPPDQPPRLLAS
jgi:hypothetical protein